MARKPTYRKRPLATFENGTRIYAPTPSEPRYRVVSHSREGRRIHAGFDDEASARRHARRIDSLLVNAPTIGNPSRPPRTVGQLAQRYLLSLNHLSRRYQERQECVIRCWILPRLGARALLEWTPGVSEEILQNARLTRAPATVQGIGSTMRAMVTFANKHRWLSRDEDPMWHVSYSPRPEHQGQVLGYIPRDSLPTDRQCADLFDALEQRGYEHWALAMRLKHRAGLRWSELVALQPRDIEFAPDRMIRVERAAEQAGKQRQLKGTKNRQRRYTIFPASLSAALHDRVEAVAREHGDRSLLFPAPRGGLADRGSFRHIWTAAARQAAWPFKTCGAAEWHPHDLRHVAACWMLFDLRLDPAVAAMLLGHANANFTLTRYVGVRGDPRSQLNAATEIW
jgi:integrase